MSRQQVGKEKENTNPSFGKGIEKVQRSSIFGQYSEREMIAQLKGLAKDPCMPQFTPDNIQPLWNQLIRLRKFMVLEKSETPWRKRKLDQFIKDKLRAPAGLVLPKQQKKTKHHGRQLSQASSISCLLNSVDSTWCHDQKIIFESHTSSSLVTFDVALPWKQVTAEHSFADDMVDLNCPSKDVPPIVDSDESVNGSNPSSPGDSTPIQARHIGISDVVHNANSTELRTCHDPSRWSTRLLNFTGDHLQRKVIPIGPRFQADIPEWDDTAGTSIRVGAYNSDYDNLKWLGSRVWIIGMGNSKSSRKRIGKGRPNSCSCVSRGSADCTKCHILEERLRLQRELGPAFTSWKFDEMGEQVSESWSLKERRAFESLMKKKPSSNEESFWNHALKCLPHKSRRDIINYYFNVYIAHRMSLQGRLQTTKLVDTDDEEDVARVEKVAGGRSPIIPKKKARYLRSS